MRADDIRATLDHRVIDADGHQIEYLALLGDFVEAEVGHLTYSGFRAFAFGDVVDHWTATTPGFFDTTTVAAAVRAR